MNTNVENERKLVLEMLAEGKIGVDDAQRLLEKIQEVGSARQDGDGTRTEGKARAKHLRIVSSGEGSGDDLNLRIPLGLVRAGLTLDSFLPSWAQGGVLVGSRFSDLTALDTDYLRENLDDLDMTLDSDDGTSIHIFTE